MVSQKRPRRQPTARPAVSKAFIDQHKRERVLRGVAEVVCEVGPERMTVALIVSRARVARGTFYELFDSRDDAFRAAIELANHRLCLAIGATASGEGPWRERIGSVVSSLLTAAAKEPPLAELCLGLIDPTLVDSLADVLRSGRDEVAGDGPSPRTEELIACGILAVLRERLRRGETDTFGDLAEELTQFAVAPFLTSDGGPSARARR